jgi:type IV secretion system protein VirB10
LKQQSPRRATLRAGDFINAALLTAIDSEIPGTVVAQVTRNVFDHGTGRTLIIPQGARLVGKYEGRPPFGQRRAMITWREIVMPDGGALDLGSMVGTDSSGASGVEDSVDTHISPIFRAIALSTALTIGGAAAQSANSRSSGGFILNDAASGVSTKASEVGQRFVDRDLNQPPTLRIRPGWPISVIVEHDLAAPAYSVSPENELSR